MKLNQKQFRGTQAEPFETQEIMGKKVELIYLDETPYHEENMRQGRFYLWSSDGNSYKVLIDKGFYNVASYFFTEEINSIWLGFLLETGDVRRKSFRVSMLISFALPLLIIFVAMWLFQDYSTPILIGGIVLSLVGNMFYTQTLNKQIRANNEKAQVEIRETLGEEKFQQFFTDQNNYAREYFGTEEEDFEESNDEEFEVLEETDEVEVIDTEDTNEEE